MFNWKTYLVDRQLYGLRIVYLRLPEELAKKYKLQTVSVGHILSKSNLFGNQSSDKAQEDSRLQEREGFVLGILELSENCIRRSYRPIMLYYKNDKWILDLHLMSLVDDKLSILCSTFLDRVMDYSYSCGGTESL